MVRVAVEPDTPRVRESVTNPSFSRYLRYAHEEPIAVGDTWTTFVSGGCGSQTSVSIRVKGVKGGTCVDEETSFEWV